MSLSAKIWMHYRTRIFPKIKHIRGSHRLHVILRKIARTSMEKVDQSETESIFDREDWDNLIILDACRHDLYEEVEGKTDHRYTLGSSSAEFIERTFADENYEDTIVITANPHYDPEIFTDLTGKKPEEVFHSVFHTYRNKWNEEKGTVYPQKIIEDYKTAQKLLPNKRKILHFMQPHNPFIESSMEKEDIHGFKNDFTQEPGRNTVWDKAIKGEIKDEEVWKSYKETLEYTLNQIEDQKEEFKGKTIITSDHGNFVGEEGLYGHPNGFPSQAVKKVPGAHFGSD